MDLANTSQNFATQGRASVLSVLIKDKAALYAAYMPFVKGGGLFVPTDRPFEAAQEVFLLLSLPETPEKIPVSGKVIWITPSGALANRPQGIGLQFNEKDGGGARRKIEELLVGMLQSDRPTHTL